MAIEERHLVPFRTSRNSKYNPSALTLAAENKVVGGVELPPCPVCRKEVPAPLFYEASTYSEGETVGLSRCPDCRVHFTRPRLVRHNVSTREAHYEDVVRKYEGEARSGNFHKDPNYRLYLKIAERRLALSGREPPYSVLDIGPHCGFFLRFAKERGWIVRGIEPSPPHARFAREVNGVQSVDIGFFDKGFALGERFDLVTMFDVLEHIPDPVPHLREIHARLHPGGLVLAKVPHIEFYRQWWPWVSFMSRLGLLPRFNTYDAPPPETARNENVLGFFGLFEHVVHYDRFCVESVFGAAGFDETELVPAPPTNPPGHYLNVPRSLTYGAARVLHALGAKPGALTHGLLIVGRRTAD